MLTVSSLTDFVVTTEFDNGIRAPE